jgi:hypothetical protein
MKKFFAVLLFYKNIKQCQLIGKCLALADLCKP